MINIWVLILTIAGFFVAWYIYYKKSKEAPMVCVIGKKCDEVLHSKYNKMFGVPNENIGMLYYIILAVLVILFLSGFTTIAGISVNLTILIITSVAVLASIYLTFIQWLVLKKWCDYCIGSTIINVLILIVEII